MICEVDFPLGGGGERLQHRFADPVEQLVANTLDEVVDVLVAAQRHAEAGRWVVGLVTYEAAPAFDAALRTAFPGSRLPFASFAVYVDVESRARAPDADGFACGIWRMDLPRPRFDADIDAIRRDIGDGCYYQTNHTTRLSAAFAGDAHACYLALRAAQPDAYCAYLDGGDWQVASVSPELFFEWTPDRRLTMRPMKGTAPRHPDVDLDAAAARSLRDSEKERAENLMIVDLLRNDLGRIAETGTVRVPSLFALEALPTAWQMTSTVACATRPGTNLVDVFRALFPCGSVTGAPKVAAMAAIAAREDTPRGAYCGAIGLIRPGGHAIFNVGIRTVAIDPHRAEAECGVGSGITADSTAAAEHAEWLVKRRFLLRGTASFELLETLRLEEGRYWLLDGHLGRLSHSAAHFGFALDLDTVERFLADLAAAHVQGAHRVRLLLGRDGTVRSEIAAIAAPPPVVPVALAATAVDSVCEFLQHKTTERAIYTSRAVLGVFDTLLFNERDEITEFTRGNVVVELDGARVTPPASSGLLPGVWRAAMLRRAEVTERVVTRSDLRRAGSLWFVNSVRGSLPARLLVD